MLFSATYQSSPGTVPIFLAGRHFRSQSIRPCLSSFQPARSVTSRRRARHRRHGNGAQLWTTWRNRNFALLSFIGPVSMLKWQRFMTGNCGLSSTIMVLKCGYRKHSPPRKVMMFSQFLPSSAVQAHSAGKRTPLTFKKSMNQTDRKTLWRQSKTSYDFGPFFVLSYSNAHFGMVAGMQEMVMFSLEHSPREKLINSQNTLKLRELSRTHDQTGAHISFFFFFV